MSYRKSTTQTSESSSIGSSPAIFDVFSPYQIGGKVHNLWNVGVSDGNPYENNLCRITREPLVRKAHRKPSRQRKE
ncbi:MAG: hypothetical protein IKN86_04270 [Bacteroidaceae bacterium]|nr:hypothetical protein [Bacteroidaceae bacterium]